jgi:hypothetical protein
VVEDFLRKVWWSKIEFVDIADPKPLPIGVAGIISDNVGFIGAE